MAGKSTQEIYEEVTEGIVALLKRGVAVWRIPYMDRHHNPVTGTDYRGVNQPILEASAIQKGFNERRWVTFRGAQALGGKIRKGEKGTTIVFWKFFKKEEDGVEKTIPMLRYFTVFNVEQCEGLNLAPLEKSGDALNPIEEAEKIVQAFTDAPKMVNGGGRAWYRQATDEIGMPERASFESAEAWYKVLFHEMVHGTGHASRLDNGLCGEGQERGRKELGAEAGAAMLCGRAGILTDDSMEQSAAYIESWIKTLTEDPGAFIWAMNRAQKAADYIAGVREESPEPATA
jgi:antirestriction protein ArdC